MSDTKADGMPVRPEWVIELADPVTWQSGSFSEVRLREPTMGELNKALGELGAAATQQQQNKMQIVLVTLVSGLPRPVVEAMPWPVVVGAADWLMSFTAAAPPTPPS